MEQKILFTNRFIEWASKQKIEKEGDASTIRTMYGYLTLDAWKKEIIDGWIDGKLEQLGA